MIQGEVEALDRAVATARLQEEGHVLLRLEASKPLGGIWGLLSRDIALQRRPGPRLVVDLTARLSLLLDSGVALEGALALLATTEGTAMVRSEAAALLRSLRAGAGLAEAMASREKTFPAVVVAMVRAGEASGNLAPTLNRLAGHLARAEAVRQSIRSALVYPGVLLATASGSVLLILLVVLPQLEPVFADSGANLPLLTKLAFGTSAIVRQDWWALIGAATVLALIGRQTLADPRLRSRRDALLLRLPVLGSALRKSEAARFARVLGTLVVGGVGLAPALALSQPVLVNQVLVDALAGVATAVREGNSLAGPLGRAGVFPDLAVQLIRIGEATGRLGGMLLRLADLLETDVQHTLDRGLALLVPVLTIGLGGLIAGIISSVMMAVLGVNDMVR